MAPLSRQRGATLAAPAGPVGEGEAGFRRWLRFP